MAYADLTRERAAGIVSYLMRGHTGAGISWYPGVYPANSNPGWFSGGPLGQYVDMAWPGVPGGEPSASDFAARMRAYANVFGGIRMTRIVIYYSTSDGLTVQYDGTAVASTIYNVGDYGSQVPLPGISLGSDMTEENIQACTYNMMNYYTAYCRNQTQTLTNTVCHTSCHTSCHSSRGRR